MTLKMMMMMMMKQKTPRGTQHLTVTGEYEEISSVCPSSTGGDRKQRKLPLPLLLLFYPFLPGSFVPSQHTFACFARVSRRSYRRQILFNVLRCLLRRRRSTRKIYRSSYLCTALLLLLLLLWYGRVVSSPFALLRAGGNKNVLQIYLATTVDPWHIHSFGVFTHHHSIRSPVLVGKRR